MKLKDLLNTDIHFSGSAGVVIYREDTNEYIFNSDDNFDRCTSFLTNDQRKMLIEDYADFKIVSISESRETLEIGIVK